MADNNKKFLSKFIIHFLLAIFVAALICGAVAVYYYNSTFDGSISTDHSRWGTMGDFFGGVLNPTFSLFGLLALLVTIILQSKELSQSTKEFSKSSKALNDQSESIKLQNFESTFFKLLSLHNEIVSSLLYNGPKQRFCFISYIYDLELGKKDDEKINIETRSKKVDEVYDENYDKIAFSVEHYHKNLYQILKFVDKKCPLGIDKKQYTNIIRAQLSRDELNVLFFHGLSKYGVKKFKILIERYGFFEHLPRDMFLLAENITKYKESAYGENKDLIEIYNQN